MKKNDQMYVLLAICLSLYPQVFSSHSHGSVIIFFPGGRGFRGFWGDHMVFRGKGRESVPNRSGGVGGGGLDKIECQLTANERVS